MNISYYFLIWLLLICANTSWSQDLRIGTVSAPPYQIKGKNAVSGSVADVVQCALKKSNITYDISFLPWKRTRHYLELGSLDMAFSYTENPEIDSFASFSNPMVLEKWYWYGKNKLNSDDKTIEIAAVRGSNQEGWLLSNGYTNITPVSSIPNAIKMVTSSRVKGLLVDQQLASSSAESMGFNLGELYPLFQRFSTLGAYVSNKYIDSHPDFLSQFNKNILNCKPVGIKLDESTLKVLFKVSEKIHQWAHDEFVLTSINAANIKHRDISQSKILELDQQWRKEIKSNKRDLIDKTLKNKLSVYLKKMKQENGRLYSEVFVMDEHGLNVGQSDATSDYWQGDEAKFQKSFGSDNVKPFIDGIEYDESSHTFQSQVSHVIIDPTSKKKIGAITVGINVEQALNSIR